MSDTLTPLSGNAVFLLLTQLALLLLAARLGAELCVRLRLPAVIGELAAGIALGPTCLGHFFPGAFALVFPPVAAQFHLLEVVATLGMVLLLLLTGLETEVRLLRGLGRAALIASVMGMALPFASGFVLGLFTPDAYLAQPDRRVLFSFFLATAMAISAMPVIAKILMDLDLLKRNIGLVILSAGVVDDTAGWLILSVIAGAASQGSVHFGGLLRTTGLLVLFLAAVVFVLHPVARAFLTAARRRFRTSDTDLVFLLSITFLCAAITDWIGVHAVLGAFAAGVAFRQVPSLSPDTVRRIESLVLSILAPIFFCTVGLKVNLWRIEDPWMLIVVISVACFGKLVGCTLGSVWGGLRLWEGLSIAVAMNARGAMELVVASLGLSLGILNDRMFSIIVVVAIATSFMAPLGLRFTMRRVRMTDEEARRILAAKSKGVLDPANLRILVASLGGPSDLAAERLAAALAKQSAQRVEILKVRARQPWRTRFRKLLSRERAKPDTTDAAASSEGLPAEDIQGRVVRRSIKRDDAARAVVDEASRGYDLVVLGAAGTGHWVGGHVIEDVVRSAPCHLVILKADPRGRPLLKVLAVYDGGVFSRVAVEIAARNAEASGAGLTVAVVSDRRHSTAQAELDASPAGGMPSATVGAAGEHSDGRTGATDDIAHISPVFNTLELRPEVIHVSSDSFTSRLVNEAHAGVYDLIVLGVENRAVQHRLFFGRDNETLIREASAAVAVVVPNIAQLR